MITYRKSLRGTPQQLEIFLNESNRQGKLHEVWHLGVTNSIEDIEIGCEINKKGSEINPNMIYKIIAGDRGKIDAYENDQRRAKKYIATAHRMPLHNDQQKAVAIIQIFK